MEDAKTPGDRNRERLWEVLKKQWQYEEFRRLPRPEQFRRAMLIAEPNFEPVENGIAHEKEN